MQKSILLIFPVVTALFFAAGCLGPKPVTLMSTPVIYHDATVDPFAHLLLRTDLPAHQRGLEASKLERIWYLPMITRNVCVRRQEKNWKAVNSYSTEG